MQQKKKKAHMWVVCTYIDVKRWERKRIGKRGKTVTIVKFRNGLWLFPQP